MRVAFEIATKTKSLKGFRGRNVPRNWMKDEILILDVFYRTASVKKQSILRGLSPFPLGEWKKNLRLQNSLECFGFVVVHNGTIYPALSFSSLVQSFFGALSQNFFRPRLNTAARPFFFGRGRERITEKQIFVVFFSKFFSR